MVTTSQLAPEYDDKIYMQVSATVPLTAVAKSQTDTLRLIFDYSLWLNVNEVLNTAAITFTPATVPALVTDGGQIAPNVVGLPGALAYFDVENGLFPTAYAVSLVAVTSNGRTKTDTFSLTIDDTGSAPFPGGYPISDPGEQPSLPTVWIGAGPPYTGLGAIGDYYLDTVAKQLFGPLTGPSWPTEVVYSLPASYKWNDVV